MHVLSRIKPADGEAGTTSLFSIETARAQDVGLRARAAGTLPLCLLPGCLLHSLLLASRAGPRRAGLPLALRGRGQLCLRPAGDKSQAGVRGQRSCAEGLGSSLKRWKEGF